MTTVNHNSMSKVSTFSLSSPLSTVSRKTLCKGKKRCSQGFGGENCKKTWRKPRHDDTEMDLHDIGWQGVYLTDVANDREKWRLSC